MRLLGVEHADAGGAIRLVPREHVEVGVEVAHVDAEVHRRLAAVDKHRNAAVVRHVNDLMHRHQRTEHVRHMRDGDQLGARRQKPFELLDQQFPVVGDRRPLQDHTVTLAVEVPGYDVGVMLHDRQDDLVTLSNAGEKRIRDKVDGCRGVLREDDLIGTAGVEEAACHLTRVFELLRRGVRQVVQAAMNVGVFEAIDMVHRLDHGARLLRRGGVVEIDERLAVDLAIKDREVGANALDIIRRAGDAARHGWTRRLALVSFLARTYRHQLPFAGADLCSQPRASSAKASRRSSRSTLSSASPINDSISRARACASEMPRVRQ